MIADGVVSDQPIKVSNLKRFELNNLELNFNLSTFTLKSTEIENKNVFSSAVHKSQSLWICKLHFCNLERKYSIIGNYEEINTKC